MSPRPALALYDTRTDPHQLDNLAGSDKHAAIQEQLTSVLERWMDVTGDSVPTKLSPDTFHRETGDRLPKKSVDAVGSQTPGEDRSADRINDPGPR